jgi:hypothetical protein
MTDPAHAIVEQTADKRFKKIGTWRFNIIEANLGKSQRRTDPHQPFKKIGSWRLKAKEHRPELF